MSENDFFRIAIELNILTSSQVKKYIYYYQQQNIPIPIIDWLKSTNCINEQQMETIHAKVNQQEMPVSFFSNEITNFATPNNLKYEEISETKELPVQSDLQVGNHFHHYTIQKELGRGGMGIVYQAFDNKLQRPIALKIILSKKISEQQMKSFIEEARSIAQIDHPFVVKVFEVGDPPSPYLAMEYIPGRNLSYHIKNAKWKFTEIAEIIRKCALALDKLHKKNIIHRDLKPGNIIIAKNNDSIEDESKHIPKIMDFGLAKKIVYEKGSKDDLDKQGFLGTPCYASPEQVRGENISFQTDMYSLGAILYECLTGMPPFQGNSVHNIFYQVLHSDVVSPRKLNTDIPYELEAICLKCMEKKAKNRYPNMKILAHDLQYFLENRPILARPPGQVDKFVKLVRRNKIISSFIFSIFLILLASCAILLKQVKLEKTVDVLETEKEKLVQEKQVLDEQKQELVLQKKSLENEKNILSLEKETLQKTKRELQEDILQQNEKIYEQGIGIVWRDIESQNIKEDTSDWLNKTKKHNPEWEWRWLNNMYDSSSYTMKLYENESINEDFLMSTIINNKIISFSTYRIAEADFPPKEKNEKFSRLVPFTNTTLAYATVNAAKNLYAVIDFNGIETGVTNSTILIGDLSNITVEFDKQNCVEIPCRKLDGLQFSDDGTKLLTWHKSNFFVIDCESKKIILNVFDESKHENIDFYFYHLFLSKILYTDSSSVFSLNLQNLDNYRSSKPISIKKLQNIIQKITLPEGFLQNNYPISAVKWLDKETIILGTPSGLYHYKLNDVNNCELFEGSNNIKIEGFNISPNGEYIVSWDSVNIRLWHAKKSFSTKRRLLKTINGTVAFKLHIRQNMNKCIFSHDNKYLISHANRAKIWRLDTSWVNQIEQKHILDAKIYDNLLFLCSNKKLTIWDFYHGELLGSYISFLDFSRCTATKIGQNVIIALSTMKGNILVLEWSQNNFKILKQFKFKSSDVLCEFVNDKNNTFLIIANDNTIHKYSLASDKIIWSQKLGENFLTHEHKSPQECPGECPKKIFVKKPFIDLTYNPKQKLIAILDSLYVHPNGNGISYAYSYIYNLEGKQIAKYLSKGASTLTWGIKNDFLHVGNEDGSITTIDYKKNTMFPSNYIGGRGKYIFSLSSNSNNTRIVSLGHHGQVCIWKCDPKNYSVEPLLQVKLGDNKMIRCFFVHNKNSEIGQDLIIVEKSKVQILNAMYTEK